MSHIIITNEKKVKRDQQTGNYAIFTEFMQACRGMSDNDADIYDVHTVKRGDEWRLEFNDRNYKVVLSLPIWLEGDTFAMLEKRLSRQSKKN